MILYDNKTSLIVDLQAYPESSPSNGRYLLLSFDVSIRRNGASQECVYQLQQTTGQQTCIISPDKVLSNDAQYIWKYNTTL